MNVLLIFVDAIRLHRFRHDFGTSITRKGVDPLYGKELMGIKSDKVYCRYTQGALFAGGGIALICKRLGKVRINTITVYGAIAFILLFDTTLW
ncbi:hypothetical protein [Aliterella atlantica]|uniref:Uncharacterized protein n=1 Tax=Aliterella atlantica CENA595 TaxID=1618023 RepID=A0A0D8ZLP7_9CYAN|nr:hypothetical protein [Aliterella atlantica]KJH69665.1 hypothetical protein UH38_22835 [Aliterella atlantica CENA595]